METIQAIIYHRPNGRKEPFVIEDVYPDDAQWINGNKIEVGVEDIGFDFAVYFKTTRMVCGEPEEFTFIAAGRSCRDTIKESVEVIKRALLIPVDDGNSN